MKNAIAAALAALIAGSAQPADATQTCTNHRPLWECEGSVCTARPFEHITLLRTGRGREPLRMVLSFSGGPSEGATCAADGWASKSLVLQCAPNARVTVFLTHVPAQDTALSVCE